jgi:hypothetical protein
VTSPLEHLSGPGQPLRKEAPDPGEFANLRQSGLKRLADAQNTAISAESRFDLAYNAAHGGSGLEQAAGPLSRRTPAVVFA